VSECESDLALTLYCLFYIFLHYVFLDFSIDYSLDPEYAWIRWIFHRSLNEVPHSLAFFSVDSLPNCRYPFVLSLCLSVDKAVAQVYFAEALGLSS
jgi:hypothetical protein